MAAAASALDSNRWHAHTPLAGAWEALLAQAARRAELSAGEDPQKRRAKLARWLQYRGHSWDTVKRLLREVGL